LREQIRDGNETASTSSSNTDIQLPTPDPLLAPGASRPCPNALNLSAVCSPWSGREWQDLPRLAVGASHRQMFEASHHSTRFRQFSRVHCSGDCRGVGLTSHSQTIPKSSSLICSERKRCSSLWTTRSIC
jgi:hypothetical protein